MRESAFAADLDVGVLGSPVVRRDGADFERFRSRGASLDGERAVAYAKTTLAAIAAGARPAGRPR